MCVCFAWPLAVAGFSLCFGYTMRCIGLFTEILWSQPILEQGLKKVLVPLSDLKAYYVRTRICQDRNNV